MEIYNKFIKIIDANLIYCLIPMILILIIIDNIFRDKFSTKKVLNLICWIIIPYTVINLIRFIIGTIFFPDNLPNINRTTGFYQILYWIMFILSNIVPFTLFIKKYASKFWYVLLIAFFIKIGIYFELYVIITTTIHRDYLTENGISELVDILIYGLSPFILQSLILVTLALGILKLIERKKTV